MKRCFSFRGTKNQLRSDVVNAGGVAVCTEDNPGVWLGVGEGGTAGGRTPRPVPLCFRFALPSRPLSHEFACV